jgi:hypothetical protein
VSGATPRIRGVCVVPLRVSLVPLLGGSLSQHHTHSLSTLLDVATGNFPTVTRVLLAKIPPEDGKMTYVYDNHVFHYIVENSICYLCMSDELNKHRIPYAFLQDMKEGFLAQYGHEAPLTAHAFCYNDEFSRILQERMDYYNSDEADKAIDNIGSVKSQIDEVKGIMVQNIEKVRGWK